jgi:hypothetical protein
MAEQTQAEWYATIPGDDNLEQGDSIENCKIILPQKDDYSALLKKSDTAIQQDETYKSSSIREQLRQGNQPAVKSDND